MISLLDLDPAGYRPHPLHSHDRAYNETNCYTDVLIELLSARGDEPLAVLGHTIMADFEGDQWTFFKPPPEDLRRLFGIEVREMQTYREIDAHIELQLLQGRAVVPELDAWFLPDTGPTSYRSQHVKTSVIAESIDREAQVLRYFHNAGYYELSGDDYRGAFHVPAPTPGPERRAIALAALPPYLELIRFDAGPRLRGEALRAEARTLFTEHLARRPAVNPFSRFAVSLDETMPELLTGPISTYHAYAFANVRMFGAAFSLAAAHLEWVFGDRVAPAVAAFERIADASKGLTFRLARRRAFDVAAAIAPLEADWAEAFDALDSAC